MSSAERQLENELIKKLRDLKYEYREDIRDRATLEKNFREKFEALNRVKLTDGEFQRLLDEIVTPDVFTAAKRSAALAVSFATARRSTSRWPISRTGARTASRWSASSASTPTTATTATTSSC
jgi:type I site-specific restriction-modification system R (restriction) subunit